ncbi:MAG: hypothetical protein CSB48_00715 [Proteobacteria bacterium]|nr:MAG: hypothetical protein CSB48_00715 [Pseudomonadota bacterium]
MNGNFPDYHNFPERDKGEESFWPSFTDIMMVITMVFLLVTVVVISNNWKLVTDLQASMEAQRLAAEQALDKEAKNHTLEDRMHLLENRLKSAQEVVAEKRAENQDLQAEIERILAKSKEIEQKLVASLKLAESHQRQVVQRDEQIQRLKTDRDKQLATLENRAEALAELQRVQQSSQAQVLRLQAALNAKQTELADSKQVNEERLVALQKKLENSELALTHSRESQQLSETQLNIMREELAKVQAQRADSLSKLESLQGEFDVLDSKYQKLLRPARSSRGKHVVSVWFSKQTGREVYRIRDATEDAFKTVTRQGMASALARLKDKHGKDLYVKVIIPENSGLSYSEAWRFTTEMQRAYDYYYQDDE